MKLQLVLGRRLSGLERRDGGGVGPALQALVLPARRAGGGAGGDPRAHHRSAVLDVLREDFVRTARAKGLTPRGVLWRHVLRNAMVPVLTVMGLQFANLLTGTIVIENVFSLPGLGRLVFQAIANRDLLVVRNVVMLLAAVGRSSSTSSVDVLYVGDRSAAAGEASMSAVVPPVARRPGVPAPAARTLRWRRASFAIGAVLVALLIAPGAALLRLDAASADRARHPAQAAAALVRALARHRQPRPRHRLAADRRRAELDRRRRDRGRHRHRLRRRARPARRRARGWVEEVVMRLADFTFAFPALLSAIMLTAIYGPGLVTSIVAIGIFNIPVFARITRAARQRRLVARVRARRARLRQGRVAHHASSTCCRTSPRS